MDSLIVEDPHALFDAWLEEAGKTEPTDPNAMTVATVSPDGRPSARILLLKGHDAGGFVFYTNLESRKGQEIAATPVAALLFHWKSLARQIRIEGPLAPVTEAEADAYFASRHRISRIGAWASDQSRPLENRAVLEARVAEMEAKFEGGEPPRPPHWSGFRLTPEHMEFWQDMPYRLHDRVIYTPKPEGGWATQRLFP